MNEQEKDGKEYSELESEKKALLSESGLQKMPQDVGERVSVIIMDIDQRQKEILDRGNIIKVEIEDGIMSLTKKDGWVSVRSIDGTKAVSHGKGLT